MDRMKAQCTMPEGGGHSDAFRIGQVYYELNHYEPDDRGYPVIRTWRFEGVKQQNSKCRPRSVSDEEVYKFSLLMPNEEVPTPTTRSLGERSTRMNFLEMEGLLNALLCNRHRLPNAAEESTSAAPAVVVYSAAELRCLLSRGPATTLELMFVPTPRTLQELSRSVTLKDLRLCGPKVTDTIIPSVSELAHLEELDLNNTSVGDGVGALSGSESLRTLMLCQTRVTDAAMSGLGQISHLNKLYLSATRVSNQGIRRLRPATELEDLLLDDTLVDDGACEALATLPSLKRLCIGCTASTDVGLQALQRSERLEGLYLDGTDVSDRGLRIIEDWSGLKEVSLRGTRVSHRGVLHLLEARPDLDVFC